MKQVVVVLLALLVACGQKRNPDRCCVDESDCGAIGLPNGSVCASGELCRGNECVELTCSTSAECDPSAPYCEDQRCAEACVTDESCPFTSPQMPYCVAGDCVQCRDTSDCGDMICGDGRCRGCATDAECASGLCLLAQGTCATVTDVAFASATGSPTSNCSPNAPCTLLRALSIDPPRKTIKLAAGTYENASTLTIEGTRALVGDDVENTKITNLGTGPVLLSGVQADVSLERLEIFGAKTGVAPGIGVQCISGKLRLNKTRLRGNASDGLRSTCDLTVSETTITTNGGFGAELYGDDAQANYLFERTTVSANQAGGIKAVGRGTIRTVFITAAAGTALEVSGTGPGSFGTRPVVDFTSIASGGTAVACVNDNSGSPIAITNVAIRGLITNPLVTANTRVCSFSGCVLELAGVFQPGCVLAQFGLFTSSTDLHLLDSLDNPAVNAASGGVGLLDIDGELRPKGGASDIGADEAL